MAKKLRFFVRNSALFFVITTVVFFISGIDQQVVIGFGGDTMLGRTVNEYIGQTGYNKLWGDIRPILKKNNLNIVNLETTLTTSTDIVPKVFNFKAAPDRVNALKAAYINIVNLANNHSLDFGVSGLQETIQVLDQAGICHVGAGNTIQEVQKPVIITINGITIGVIGFTDNEPGWKAGPDKPGVNYVKVGDIEPLRKSISELRRQVDILIVTCHWGPNMRERPSREFRQFAHELIDLGIDIIHGHSAHIFQGVEIYNKKVIMYDTGDLIDDYAVDPVLRNDQSFLFLVTIEKENSNARIKRVQLIPLLIKNMQVFQATGAERIKILERMRTLSAEFGTTIDAQGVIQVP